MKLSFRKLLIVTLFAGVSAFGYSQANQNMPIDPNIRHGVLPNGMKYYIKHNSKPEKTADFYIANAVGSLQEDDNQHGLAHFLEHMAFNGTKNFPEKSLFTFLEGIGASFGGNINAYTYYDETVYNLKEIPLLRETIIDSCILVLNDWSSYITLADKEIDSERGVIHEEYRTRMGGGRRAMIEANAILFKDSKYGKRTVIGDLEVIDNFPYERIKTLYKDWYRPDLQAVIIVGDIDVDQVEKKVKDILGKIPARTNVKERIVDPIPENIEPRFAIVKDPEAVSTQVNITIKHPRIPREYRNSPAMLVQNFVAALYSQMINERFNEIVQNGNPPFVYGASNFGHTFLPIDAVTFRSAAKGNGVMTAYNALLTELERVKRYGFTTSEFERAKTSLLNRYEKAYNERNNMTHEDIVTEIVRHFLENVPMPGMEAEYKMAQQILGMVTVDQFNQAIKGWFTDKNILVSVTGPDKGIDYPTEAELLEALKASREAKVDAYKDDFVVEPLVATVPKGSKVVKEEFDKSFGTTKWTLANGVKVIIKQTDFKKDEINMSATSKGGLSLVPTKDIISGEFATTVVEMSGLGKFDPVNLKKQLTGKTVRVSPVINTYSEGFSGVSSVKDFEAMLQLVYLNFTAPRFDEEKFNTFMGRVEAYMANQSKDPNANFRDSIQVVMNSRSDRRPVVNAAALKHVDFNAAKNIFADRFANAGDFTFTFVGNIDPAKTKSLIESYLGALPNTGRKESWKDDNVKYPSKNIRKTFDFKMETPKTALRVSYAAPYKYNLRNNLSLRLFAYLLDIRYTQSIREESGGAYTVGVWSENDIIPSPEFKLNVQFDTDPEKAEDMIKIVHKEIAKILAEGPTQEDMDKTIEYFAKQYNEATKKNAFWISSINSKEKYNYDAITDDAFLKELKAMTPKKLKKNLKKLFKKSNKIEILMNPQQ